MDEFMSEKEQLEALRKWWQDNGAFLIAGLVLGIALLAGWRWMESWKQERAERASDTYQALVEAVEEDSDVTAAAALATTLRDEYSATPYAALGELMLARAQVEAGDLDGAAGSLRWVLDNGDDPQLDRVARERLARVEIARGDAQAALELLDVDAGAFAPIYHELRGDALASLERTQEAHAAYRQALDAVADGVGDRRVLEMKLDQTRTASSEGDN